MKFVPGRFEIQAQLSTTPVPSPSPHIQLSKKKRQKQSILLQDYCCIYKRKTTKKYVNQSITLTVVDILMKASTFYKFFLYFTDESLSKY